MSKRISVDLHQRVCQAVQEGLSFRLAAARFKVSASSAIRWVSLLNTAGSCAPRPQCGERKSGRIEAEAAFMLARVAETPDITLTELQRLLCARAWMSESAPCGASSIGGGSALKQTAHAADQDRADVAAAREAGFAAQIGLDPEMPVFVHETGENTKTTRLRERAARGE